MGAEEMNSQVVWFDMPVLDLDRAIAFYSAVLDCEVEKQTGPGFEMGVLPHEGQAVGGCLSVCTDNKPSDSGILIYLNCEGRLDAAIAAAETGGAEIQQAKHAIGPHGFRAVIKDCEGNRVALHSHAE